MEIGDRIRKYRKLRGMTQKELSKLIDVTPPTVTKYENGNLRIDTDMLTKIGASLEVSVEELLGVQKLSASEKTYINEHTGKVTHDLAYKEIQNRIPKQDIWNTLMDMQKYAYDKSNFYIGLGGKEYEELLNEVINTINNHAYKIELKRQGKI